MKSISAELEPNFEANLVQLLKDYRNVFAWSYQDMLGLSSKLMFHKLTVNPNFKPVKQVARNFRKDILLQIKRK